EARSVGDRLAVQFDLVLRRNRLFRIVDWLDLVDAVVVAVEAIGGGCRAAASLRERAAREEDSDGECVSGDSHFPPCSTKAARSRCSLTSALLSVYGIWPAS